MKKVSLQKMFDAVTVGERGQIVIPVSVRKLFGIKAGDKLIIFTKGDGPIKLVPAECVSHFLEEASAMVGTNKAKSVS